MLMSCRVLGRGVETAMVFAAAKCSCRFRRCSVARDAMQVESQAAGILQLDDPDPADLPVRLEMNQGAPVLLRHRDLSQLARGIPHLLHVLARQLRRGDPCGIGEHTDRAGARADLDGLAAVPHRVAFDDVEPSTASVNEDARVLPATGRVVDHVVAHRVVVGADLDLDPVIAAVATSMLLFTLLVLIAELSLRARRVESAPSA